MKRQKSKTPKPKTNGLTLSIEQQRMALARKLEMLIAAELKSYRRCSHPACRRARQCRPPELHCVAPKPPARVLTPEEDARVMGDLKRALERRLGRR